MTGSQSAGIPHEDPPEADVFTGTVPAADVGEPGNLGAAIGVPSSGQEIGEPYMTGDTS